MNLRCVLTLLLAFVPLSATQAQVQDYEAFPLPDDPPYMTLYVSLITVLFTYEAPESTSRTSASSRDDKLIRAAGEDAASFVASQGAIRGVQLEAALRLLRERPASRHYSDLQLAEAILLYAYPVPAAE